MDFSETIAASDLKGSRSRHLIEFMKVISLPYIYQVLYVLCFTWTRYQVSVYRIIGPLVAYAKTKTQISFMVTAKLISAFVFATRIVQSLYFLNPKGGVPYVPTLQFSSSFAWLIPSMYQL